MLEAIRNESTSPPLAARNMAIVHAAIFDAINAIDRTCDPYLFHPNPPPGALPAAAAIGAAYESLVRLYPSQTALFEGALNRTLATVPPGQNRDDGFTLGQLVAFLTLAWRGADGSSTAFPYVPGTNPGDWHRTPPFFRPPELPQWPYVIPFTMTNGAQFRPAGPPSLTSTQYTLVQSTARSGRRSKPLSPGSGPTSVSRSRRPGTGTRSRRTSRPMALTR